MKKRIIALLVFVAVCIFALYAYVIGGSNLSLGKYPSFSKMKPSKPYTSYNGTVSRSQYESYKREVEAYIDAAEDYIDNGNNDIKRIQDAQSTVVQDANKVVDEYNSWLKTVSISSSYY